VAGLLSDAAFVELNQSISHEFLTQGGKRCSANGL
jgi:hypothetical protein